MFKNRFIVVLGLLSLLLLGMAVSQSRPLGSSATGQDAPIAVTGESKFPDYFQRHPELSVQAERSIDIMDYFFRHLAGNTHR